MHYVYEHYYNEIDWILKADDDSYVIIENLRNLLSLYEPESALHFGHKLMCNKQLYMDGGAGYVLSREALRRLIVESFSSNTDSDSCNAYTETGAEDVNIAKCLLNVGVIAGLDIAIK